MITSSWVAQKTFMSPFPQWDPKDFSNTIDVWDLKERKIIQTLKGDPVPLAARWALKTNATYGYTISNGGDALWQFRSTKDEKFPYLKTPALAKSSPPANLHPSP